MPHVIMPYAMKQKLFTWGYTILDETGRNVYSVDGKAMALRAKLSFQDLDGNELAFIRERALSWGPTFGILRDGRVAAAVRKKLFTFLRRQFIIDEPGPDDPVATGDLLDHEYGIRRGDETIALVSKKWFTWSRTYGVDIAPGEDDVLLLAATVVIDIVCARSRDT